MKVVYGIIGSIILIGCQEKRNETIVLDQPVEPVVVNSLNNKAVPDGLLILKGIESDENIENAIQDNLYGRFFEERAEFFVIENPSNKIYNSGIKSITMFYLDGQLSQTKYILNHDIVDNLIKQFGSFTIIGLDSQNKKLIEDKQVMNADDGNRLNAKLDHYEIFWRLGVRQIRYQVNKKDEREKFRYVERVSNYERAYKAVESSVN